MQCQNGVKSFLEEHFHYSRIRRCLAWGKTTPWEVVWISIFLLFRENQLGHYLFSNMFFKVTERYKDPQLTCFTYGLNQNWILNAGKTLLCFERFREFFWQCFACIWYHWTNSFWFKPFLWNGSAGDCYTFPIL